MNIIETYNNMVMAHECPHCHKKFTVTQWNIQTRKRYSNITHLHYNIIDMPGYNFICPGCKGIAYTNEGSSVLESREN